MQQVLFIRVPFNASFWGLAVQIRCPSGVYDAYKARINAIYNYSRAFRRCFAGGGPMAG